MINYISIIVVLYNDFPKDYIYNQSVPVIIVDNTLNRNLGITGNDIYYIPLGKNYGIAKALNVGFKKAKELNSKWVLTMDQDSELPFNILYEYDKYINMNIDRAAIFSPIINMYDGEKKQSSAGLIQIPKAITSGSIICVKAFDDVGGFLEKLFIDEVDFEFCLHLRSRGYKIFKVNTVVMQHRLGNIKEVKLFGKHLFYVLNHNYIRRYYMSRNKLLINHMYKDLRHNANHNIISILKIVLFEKDVIRKIKAIRLGRRDYFNNKFGEFDYYL